MTETPHTITPLDIVNHFAPRDANISPDGRYVAFGVRHASKTPTGELPQELWLADVQTGESRQITVAGTTDHSPRWSPDSRLIVFVSDRRDSQRQLYLTDVEGGEAVAITDLRGDIDSPAWSPDGQRIAFRWREASTGTDDPHIEGEARGYMRIWAVEAVTGELRALTPDGYEAHEYVWSPDGTKLALVAKAGDATGSGWYTAQIYTLDVASGEMRQVCQTPRSVCALAWSPDSRQIAYLTSLISDQPLWSGDVCIVDANGGEPRQMTPRDLPFSIHKLDWRQPDQIIYSATQDGGAAIGILKVSNGQTETLWSDFCLLMDWTVPRINVAANGKTFATIVERPDTPGQVFVGHLDRAAEPWKQVSQLSYPPLQLGRVELARWSSTDGFEITGMLVYPVGYETGKRYPTFVQIYGGPTWQWQPHYMVWWEWWAQYLAGNGYVVLLPNIRGSTGRGTAYAESNYRGLGVGDFEDTLAGVDHLIALGLADPDRLGIGGWSYGGFMTSWAITQTDRFKAGIMGAGLASWESYYGQAGIRDWQTVFLGSTPYDEPEFHRSLSPVTHVKQARTPSLILNGQADTDVPPAQAHEMYVALKSVGVDVELVTYPREHHPILEREHQLDLLRRVLEWLDRYMKG